MKKINFAKAEVAGLVSLSRKKAGLHGEATEEGRWRKGNPAANTIVDIYAELRRRGVAAQSALLPLIFDPSPGVRLWAGSRALEFAPAHGEAALQKLEKGNGLVPFVAQTTLRRWRTRAATQGPVCELFIGLGSACHGKRSLALGIDRTAISIPTTE